LEEDHATRLLPFSSTAVGCATPPPEDPPTLDTVHPSPLVLRNFACAFPFSPVTFSNSGAVFRCIRSGLHWLSLYPSGLDRWLLFQSASHENPLLSGGLPHFPWEDPADFDQTPFPANRALVAFSVLLSQLPSSMSERGIVLSLVIPTPENPDSAPRRDFCSPQNP